MFTFFKPLQPIFIGFIMKANRVRETARKKTGDVTLNLPGNTEVNGKQVKFFFSETGWLTTEIFLQMNETICARWKLLHPRLHARLLLENLNVNKNAVVVEKLKKSHVLPVFFPSRTIHVVQSLDFGVFAAFKTSLGRWVRNLSFHGRNAQKDAIRICLISIHVQRNEGCIYFLAHQGVLTRLRYSPLRNRRHQGKQRASFGPLVRRRRGG